MISPIAFKFQPPNGQSQEWLIAINNKMKNRDTGMIFGENGGVTAFNVGDTTTPNYPGHAPPLGQYFVPADIPALHSGDPDPDTPAADGRFVGGYAVNLSTLSSEGYAQIAVYVTYGPFDDEHNDGLMTLVGAYNRLQHTLSFTQTSKLPITLPTGYLPDTQVARVTFDPATNRLYAAYGCAGIAMYDITTDPMHPQLLAYRHLASEPGIAYLGAASPLEVVPAPNGKVLVPLIRRGVLVLDASSPSAFQSSPIVGLHATRYDANDLVRASPDPNMPDTAYWFADGAGGVHKIYFSDF